LNKDCFMKCRLAAPRRLWIMLSVAAAVLSWAGCATIEGTGGGLSKVTGDAAANPQQPVPPTGAYTIELRSSLGKPQIRQMPLTGPTLIQQALEQSGAAKRFRRMNIVLLRAAGEERHKLDVKFDRKRGTVNPLYDYAILPGDHLVVTEDNSTPVDDMLGSLSTPLGLSARR
jgi:hypothetical protein